SLPFPGILIPIDTFHTRRIAPIHTPVALLLRIIRQSQDLDPVVGSITIDMIHLFVRPVACVHEPDNHVSWDLLPSKAKRDISVARTSSSPSRHRATRQCLGPVEMARFRIVAKMRLEILEGKPRGASPHINPQTSC